MMFFASSLDASNYNYQLEICSLIFLVVLTIKFFTKKKFPNKVNKLFGFALLCAICDLSLDILGSITVEYIDTTPIWLTEIVNSLFYLFQVLFPVIVTSYVVYLSRHSYAKNKKLLILLIPASLFAIVQFLNPFTHWIFYIGENEEGQLAFLHGQLFGAFYIITGLYLFLTGFLTFTYRRNIEKKQRNSVYILLLVICFSIVLQIIFPNILFTGLAITLALYISFDKGANPDFMLDRPSGVYNNAALVTYLDSQIKVKRHYKYVILEINNIANVTETCGYFVTNKIFSMFGSFFNTLETHSWAFRNSINRFVFVYKDEKLQDSAINKINNKFEDYWKIDDYSFKFDCKIFKIASSKELASSNEFFELIDSIPKMSSSDNTSNIYIINDDYIEKLSRGKKVLEAVKKALNTGVGLSMNYQPIYDLSSDKFNHAEALLRLKDESLGNIPPNEFIEIAENAGLASQIDEYVLNTTCDFLRRFPRLAHLDINISGAEFFDNPAKKFIDIISKYNIDPNRLCFEITETAAIKYPDKVNAFMKEMIKNGFSFAIDDFGTGYSNVSQIINKPFEIVKLDRSLLNEDKRNQVFLSSMVDLFKRLKTPMVIEGVETLEQLANVKNLNIEYVQGYIFSKPLTEIDFVNFINSKEED